MLPEIGTNIKGNMRADNELLAVSGYKNQPKHFESLIRILDSDLRLITPTEDAKDVNSADGSATTSNPFYQLTHDYLVHSVRDWLTSKTERRRFEEEPNCDWPSVPRFGVQHLKNVTCPPYLSWSTSWPFTKVKSWTSSQRTMLRKATRVHATFWGGVGALLLLIGLSVFTFMADLQRRTNVEKTNLAVGSVEESSGDGIPFAVKILRELPRSLVIATLRDRFKKAEGQQRLSLACALSQLGYPEVDALVAGVINLDTQATEVSNNRLGIGICKKTGVKKTQ